MTFDEFSRTHMVENLMKSFAFCESPYLRYLEGNVPPQRFLSVVMGDGLILPIF